VSRAHDAVLTPQVAEECCDGRIVFCHEGGYNPAQTPFCGLRVVEALTGLKTGVQSPSDHEVGRAIVCAWIDVERHQSQTMGSSLW
jgi:acetoin utilization deacetylase AcuC-like enzyme